MNNFGALTKWQSAFVEWTRDVELVDIDDMPVMPDIRNRGKISDLLRRAVALAIGASMNDPPTHIDMHFETHSLMKKAKPELVSTVQNQAWFMHWILVPMMEHMLGERWLAHAEDELDGMKDNLSQLEQQNKRLQEDALTAQKRLIEVQDQLLRCQADIIRLQSGGGESRVSIQETVSSVQETVQKELKSYAAMVQKSCAKSLAPARLQQAMRKAAAEDDRSHNLIIYGLPEEENTSTEESVLQVLQHTGEKPKMKSCERMRGKGGDSNCPIKVVLHTREMVRSILAKSNRLKEVDGFSRVYLCPDRTVEQRAERRKLVATLVERRAAEPGKSFVIRKGTVQSLD